MSYTRVVLAGFLLALVLGCATAGPPLVTISVDREELLAGPPELASPAPEVDILALDDDMRAYLAQHIPEDAHNKQKARLLVKAFFADGGIQVRYDNIKTYTATEAFHAREGNCLSFTNLFVAMAREVGLKAYYQEVETPPVWNSEGELYLYNRHINVLLRHRSGDDEVVDFDMANFNEEFPRKRIPDEAAVAQYHNNMGVHWLLREDAPRALAHQRLALQLQPDVDYMWTNLGVIYGHFGYSDHAEGAFLTALGHHANEPVAISNLARLYTNRGDAENAGYYNARAQKFRRKNPYYLYSRAERLYEEGEYAEATDELRRAIQLYKEDHRFHRLMGLSWAQLGEAGRAEASFEKAAALAKETTHTDLYARKLQLLSQRFAQ